ncbi:uncharacterized protein [Halyomorpha halys]|uniref:uncharacterized protein n=1 Tax=Halyomorpha halys TaxID=286706 RepID=UPI0006D50E33|nr:uncharacterized protein LOC106681425 isoform X2 [Halyomorpha halys]
MGSCFSKCGAGTDENSEDGNEEGTPMGPMTLREYVNTLEPYNPWVHGWRGEEPRRVWDPAMSPPTPMPVQKSVPGDKSQSAANKNRRHAHK